MFLKRIFINTVSLFDYNKLWFYYSFYLEENDGVAVFPEDVSRLSSSSRLAKAGLGSSSRLVKAISGPSSRLAKAISGPSSRREGGPWVELTSCEDGRLSSSLSQVVAPTSRAGPNLSTSPQSQYFPQIKTKVSPQIWLLDYWTVLIAYLSFPSLIQFCLGYFWKRRKSTTQASSSNSNLQICFTFLTQISD